MDFLFPTPLIKGQLVERYKRFFADVLLSDGTKVTAHCPNTGSMKTCGSPGDGVYLLYQPSPKRKLSYTWELTEVPGGFVGVNTGRPNQVVKIAVEKQLIPVLSGYHSVRSEIKYGVNSRIDLLLSEDGRPDCYVEIKNTTLLHESSVMFPDAVTERGRKHLEELCGVVKEGKRAVMLFFVNRPDGLSFKAAEAIDPLYAKELRRAQKLGVEVLAYRATHSPEGISLAGAVNVDL